MKNALLLCAAMSVSVPAFAQTTTPVDPDSPMTQAVPAQTATPAPADPVVAAQPAPGVHHPADPAQGAAATPAQTAAQPGGETQVAQVVDSEFASYDRNKDGVLSKAEFGAWMVALKSASDPDTKADAPATRTWAGRAFASADKDRNSSVSKSELTGFLSQGRS